MYKQTMYLPLTPLICILLIAYATSFQEAERNMNLLENKDATESDFKIKNYSKVQFPNNTNNIPDIFESESSELTEDDMLTDILNKHEIEELKQIVSSIEEFSVYDGIYHPFEPDNNTPNRRRKRETDTLAQNLNDLVTYLENMVNATDNNQKKKYFDKATSKLDTYIEGVKNSVKGAKKSTIQIMKLDTILIVQCAGWLWYPISRLNKTITCADSVMRFENRDKTLAHACNLYNCMDLAL